LFLIILLSYHKIKIPCTINPEFKSAKALLEKTSGVFAVKKNPPLLSSKGDFDSKSHIHPLSRGGFTGSAFWLSLSGSHSRRYCAGFSPVLLSEAHAIFS